VKAFFQTPSRFRRACALFFVALGLPFAAHALELEGSLILAMGSYDLAYSQYQTQLDDNYGLDFYQGLGYGEGSIVQIVAVTQDAYTSLTDSTGRGNALSDWTGATGQDANDFAYSTQDETQYFENADDSDAVLNPETTLDGQKIIQTTSLDSNLEASFRFNYTDLINQGYVGFYLRVFSTNEFVQGEVASNVVWGASALYKFQGYQGGGEVADFSGITIVGTNHFEVIPEPATSGLFLFGAAALLARRRRKPSRPSLPGGRAMSKNILLSVVFCAILSASGSARASVVNPVYLTPDEPIVDALGDPFPGTCNTGDGGLVEIREVGSGIVAPDAITGAGDDEANPLLLTGHLGDNTLGRDSGLFTIAIRDTNSMPKLGTAYFARVFDAPAASDAALYSDSDPFTLANYSSIATTTYLSFNESRSVDPDADAYLDSNGDGYSDRVEAYLRSHDSDGDGWSDWFELVHGMDASAPFSMDDIALEDIEEPDLAAAGIASIDSLTDEELDSIPWKVTGKGISWTAVSGVTYVVEFAPALGDSDAFSGVLTNVADGTDGFADVSDYLTNSLFPLGFFRVKAVPQPGEGPEE